VLLECVRTFVIRVAGRPGQRTVVGDHVFVHGPVGIIDGVIRIPLRPEALAEGVLATIMSVMQKKR
jgi:hypothetical protein